MNLFKGIISSMTLSSGLTDDNVNMGLSIVTLKRELTLDPSTIYRWVIFYAPKILDILKEKETITKKMGDKVLHHLIKNYDFEHEFKTLMNALTFITKVNILKNGKMKSVKQLEKRPSHKV